MEMVDTDALIYKHRAMAEWLMWADDILESENQELTLRYGTMDYWRGHTFSVQVPREVWAIQLKMEAERVRLEVNDLDAKLRAYLDAFK
jgi:hypothetical protein